MPEQQNFVSYVLLQLQTPKAYYCKETKKKSSGGAVVAMYVI